MGISGNRQNETGRMLAFSMRTFLNELLNDTLKPVFKGRDVFHAPHRLYLFCNRPIYANQNTYSVKSVSSIFKCGVRRIIERKRLDCRKIKKYICVYIY